MDEKSDFDAIGCMMKPHKILPPPIIFSYYNRRKNRDQILETGSIFSFNNDVVKKEMKAQEE